MSRPFTDQYGTELTIAGETALPGCARIGISERCGAHIPADDFPEFIAALYAAAGKPEPVILERPEPRDCLAPGAGDGRSWVDVERSPAASHGRGITEPGRPGVSLILRRVRSDGSDASVRLIGDEPLRVALALVDAMRPAADEPDPAEVEELTRILRRIAPGMAPPGEGDYKTAVVRPFAEAALRWMREQQRGERS